MRIRIYCKLCFILVFHSCEDKPICTEYISFSMGFVKVDHDSIYTVCFGQSPVELEYRKKSNSDISLLIGDFDTLVISELSQADTNIIRLMKGDYVEEFICAQAINLNDDWNVATIILPGYDPIYTGKIVVDQKSQMVNIFIGNKELHLDPERMNMDHLFNEITLLNTLPPLKYTGSSSHAFEIQYTIRDGRGISAQSTVNHLPLRLSGLRALVEYLNDKRSVSEVGGQSGENEHSLMLEHYLNEMVNSLIEMNNGVGTYYDFVGLVLNGFPIEVLNYCGYTLQGVQVHYNNFLNFVQQPGGVNEMLLSCE